MKGIYCKIYFQNYVKFIAAGRAFVSIHPQCKRCFQLSCDIYTYKNEKCMFLSRMSVLLWVEGIEKYNTTDAKTNIYL